MSVTVPVTSDVVPANLTCIISNTHWQALIGLLSVTQQEGSIVNLGNATPAADMRQWPWFRQNTDGTPDKLYIYALGAWLSAHPLPPGIVTMYEGTEASITTFDGGESAAVTSTTGPFWERVTEMNGRMPIQPGTLQPSGTIIGAENVDGGADEITLTDEQLPSNPFGINNFQTVICGVTSGGPFSLDADPAGTNHRGGNWEGNDEPHDNMPPYRSIWFIRRTNRLYYRAP